MTRTQTFYDRLSREAAAGKMALIGLYATRDRLLYVESPALKKQYMQKIGIFEEPVLEAELDTAMLKKKADMIQIALNRREPIDLEAIDEQLKKERREQVNKVESADSTLRGLPELSGERMHAFQSEYNRILKSFHPAVNSSLTETQKDLFERAADAYRMQDADAMQLIYDVLFLPEDAAPSPGTRWVREDPDVMERRMEYRAAAELSTDYRLAERLYRFFTPLEKDRVMIDALKDSREKIKEVEEEIRKIRSGFPFSAAETLNDRDKTEEYLSELRLRALQCQKEKAGLEARIKSMTEADNG